MIRISLLVTVTADIPVYGAPGSKTGEAQRFPTIEKGPNGYWVLALHWPQTTCEIINQNTELENCGCELGNAKERKFRGQFEMIILSLVRIR